MTARPVPVILAAGMGTRLGADRPKCMVEVCGRPILARTLDALRGAGLGDGVVVVGFAADRVARFVAEVAGDPRVQIEVNDAYATTGTARSLALGLARVPRDRPVLIIEADVAFEPAVLSDLLDHPAGDAIAVEREQPFHSGSVVTVDDAGWVTRWYHERTRPPELTRDRAWKTANLNRLSAATWTEHLLPALAEAEAGSGARAPAEYAYAAIAGRPALRIAGVDIGGRAWFEVDTPEDLALAEERLAGL